MSYSTNSEVIAAIGESKLMQVQVESVAVSTTKLAASRARARGIMDGYLCTQAVTPVDTVDRSHLAQRLRDVEIDLVRFFEYAREDVAAVPELVKDQYDEAMQWLKDVRDRKVSLTPGAGQSCSFEVVRGDARPLFLRAGNIEFNPVTQDDDSAGDATFYAPVGDDTLTAFIAPLPGWLSAIGFRQYDSLSTGQQVIFTPYLDGEIVGTGLSTDDYSVVWSPTSQVARHIWYSIANAEVPEIVGAFDFEAGDTIAVKCVQSGSVTAGLLAKVFLNVLYYAGPVDAMGQPYSFS